MRIAQICFLGCFSFTCLAAGQPLQVRQLPQKAERWCWAAATEMVLNFHGVTAVDRAQCRQAQARISGQGSPDCCAVPLCQGAVNSTLPSICDSVNWPDFPAFGFDVECSSGALSWEALFSEVSTGRRPVIATWRYAGNIFHAMVIGGARVAGGIRVLSVINPAPTCIGGAPPRRISYQAYKRVRGHHVQSFNFFKIMRGAGTATNCPAVRMRTVSEMPLGSLRSHMFEEFAEEILDGPAESDEDQDQDQDNSFSGADEAASVSWRSIVTSARTGDSIWGIDDMPKMDKATLGIPMDEYFVDSADLAVYQDRNPMLALRPTNRRVFPLEINGSPVASLTVFKDGGVWRFDSFDPGQLSSDALEERANDFLIVKTRSELAAADNLSEFMKLEIPATGVALLGVIRGDKLFVSPSSIFPALAPSADLKKLDIKLFNKLQEAPFQ